MCVHPRSSGNAVNRQEHLAPTVSHPHFVQTRRRRWGMQGKYQWWKKVQARSPLCSNLWRPSGPSKKPMNNLDRSKRNYDKSYTKPTRICDMIDVSRDNVRRTRLRETAPSLSRGPSWTMHYVAPKIAFTRVEDPESHLTAFNAHMIISGGSNVVRCKMFMGTCTGTTIQWFSGFPDGHISSFAQFAKLFREQFHANRVKLPVLFDLFNVRQREGETLKDYLNRLCALTVTILKSGEEQSLTSTLKKRF